MSGEEKVYTKGELEILVATARVETMQCVLNDSFNEHKKEDEVHFERLYRADKKILDEIAVIPEKMAQCSEKIKTDVLSISRSEFATNVDFQVLKTKIYTAVMAGTAIGSITGTILHYAWSLIKLSGA